MESPEPTSRINWRLCNRVGRAYVLLQKRRIAFGLQTDAMITSELIRQGLYVEEIVPAKTEDQVGIGKKSVPIYEAKVKPENHPQEYTEAEIEAIDMMIKQIRESTQGTAEYGIMNRTFLGLLKLEKEMLHDGAKLIEDSDLWRWCLRVKGLKEVAGLTFAAFVNIDKEVVDKKTGLMRQVGVGEIWSYLGMTPGSKMVRGDKDKDRMTYAKGLKGRFIGIIAPNILRSQDPYYYPIYVHKKQYYLNRPDILAKYTPEKGLKAVCHRMALRKLMSLLVGHAFELMLDHDDERRAGFNRFPGRWGKQDNMQMADRHRVPLPIKPEDASEWAKIHADFVRYHAEMLEMLKKLWYEDEQRGDTLHQRYYRFLMYNRLDQE